MKYTVATKKVPSCKFSWPVQIVKKSILLIIPQRMHWTNTRFKFKNYSVYFILFGKLVILTCSELLSVKISNL